MMRASAILRLLAPVVLLLLTLCFAACREVDPTQVLVEVTADSLATARGRVLHVRIWNREDTVVLDTSASIAGADATITLPTTIPIVPAGDDSARTFRIAAELVDGTGKPFNRYEGIGSFVEHQIVTRRVVLTDPCNDIVCASGQSCTDGACAPVAALPAPPPPPPPAKEVGPGLAFATPCAAITAASAGDTVLIHGGTYSGEACVIMHDALTIRGVDAKPVIDAAGARAEGTGLWVVRGANTVIENVELRNATGDDGHGAAIRLEGRNLTLRDVVVRDSQDGVYTNDDETSELLVERSELAGNGTEDAGGHNLHVGHIKRFTLRDSWSHGTIAGHLVRSRANDALIETNWLSSIDGTASYELDLPTGGRAVVLGNVLEQGGTTGNRVLLSYGEEGGLAADQYLYVAHNTFVSRRPEGATFVRVSELMTGEVRLVNDVFAGAGSAVDFAGAVMLGECTDPGDFPDSSVFDYHLPAGSPCIDRGVPAGSGAGFPLTPSLQYVHPLGSVPRAVVRAPDPGAFESP